MISRYAASPVSAVDGDGGVIAEEEVAAFAEGGGGLPLAAEAAGGEVVEVAPDLDVGDVKRAAVGTDLQPGLDWAS